MDYRFGVVVGTSPIQRVAWIKVNVYSEDELQGLSEKRDRTIILPVQIGDTNISDTVIKSSRISNTLVFDLDVRCINVAKPRIIQVNPARPNEVYAPTQNDLDLVRLHLDRYTDFVTSDADVGLPLVPLVERISPTAWITPNYGNPKLVYGSACLKLTAIPAHWWDNIESKYATLLGRKTVSILQDPSKSIEYMQRSLTRGTMAIHPSSTVDWNDLLERHFR